MILALRSEYGFVIQDPNVNVSLIDCCLSYLPLKKNHEHSSATFRVVLLKF